MLNREAVIVDFVERLHQGIDFAPVRRHYDGSIPETLYKLWARFEFDNMVGPVYHVPHNSYELRNGVRH